MPILDKWDLSLTIADVLRAQGAEPEAILQRRPALLEKTRQAIIRSMPLLHPTVLYEKYAVKSFRHERLDLLAKPPSQDKTYLAGELIAQHLARAEEVIVMLCSIGSEIDESVSSVFKTDPMMGLAMDGVGSAAVEMLAIQACNHFEAQAKDQGLKTTMPLNPGMIGWPVGQGQLQIFTLLDSEEIHVSLTESYMMVPSKSLSMVLGIGADVTVAGSSCDYCNLKGVCKYQNHYAK